MEPSEAYAVDVLFLGVNPGAKEAELGRPFVGPAGKLLRKIAHEILPGRVLAFSNVILCSTPNEAGLTDSNAAMECCSKNVRKIWDAFQPKIFVPCGAKALSRFEIKERIMAANGREYQTGEFTVVPMLHPAAVLRGCGNRTMLRDAMKTMARLLHDRCS